jgi:hypothetical protein
MTASINFTFAQVKASNEAIIKSGKPYSARSVFVSDFGMDVTQLIQDREHRKKSKAIAQNHVSEEFYELDLS